MTKPKNALLVVIFAGLIVLTAATARTAGLPSNPWDAFTRPATVGTFIGNTAYSYLNNKQGIGCWSTGETLGPVIVDQNGVEYFVTTAHGILLGPSGFLSSGAAVIQPSQSELFGLLGCPPTGGSGYQIGTIGTFTPLSFTGSNAADLAMVPVTSGAVGSSIYPMPNAPSTFSIIPVPILKKGMQIRKFGAASGASPVGTVVSKILKPHVYSICSQLQTTQAPKSCKPKDIKVVNLFEISPADFGVSGDSGSLILTTDACPQPVGILEAEGVGGPASAVPMTNALSTLQTLGNYTSLS